MSAIAFGTLLEVENDAENRSDEDGEHHASVELAPNNARFYYHSRFIRCVFSFFQLGRVDADGGYSD